MPDDAGWDLNGLRSARVLLVSALVTLFISLPLEAAAYLSVGEVDGTVATLLVGNVLMLAVPVTLRFSRSIRMAALLEFAAYMGTLPSVAYFNGGFVMPPLIWLAAVPFLAVIVVGERFAAGFAAVGAAVTVGILLADRRGYPFPESAHVPDMDVWSAVAVVTLTVFVAAVFGYESRLRRATEDALRDRSTQLATVLAHAPIVLFATDRDGVFRLALGKGMDRLGLPPAQLLGSSGMEGPEALRSNLSRAIAGERVAFKVEFRDTCWEAWCVPWRGLDGESLGAIGVGVDVTDRAHMEDGLLRADRLASIGTLAAGVAHEVNNPLSYLLTNLTLAVESLASSGLRPPEMVARLRVLMEDALEGAERVRVVVRDLHDFAREDDHPIGPTQLTPILEQAVKMVRQRVASRARIVTDLRDVPPVRGNPARLGQVFVNLLVNAADAIEEGSPEANEVRISSRLDDHSRVVVEVSDTGKGIAEEHLPHLFDPFYTTRTSDGGTGLGLFVVHNILESLGGVVDVESTPGEGSTFRVQLPLEAVAPHPAPTGMAATPLHPGRSVLIVDDEIRVASSLALALAKHDVTVCTSGKDALEKILLRPYDVVLCDLMMPQMDGMTLFERVQERRPDMAERFVFTTGGAFTQRARSFLAGAGRRFLVKPVSVRTLRRLVEIETMARISELEDIRRRNFVSSTGD